MFIQDLQLGGQLWLLTLAFGVISLPISSRLFGSLFDKGYFVGKLLGLFIVAYSLFLLATLKLLPLSFLSLVLLTLFWALVNILVWKNSKKPKFPWKIILFEEILFLLLYSLFIYIRGHQPEIYQIERFMDFGFIKALSQSQWLPLEDIWRSGASLNYYYFGHFVAYVLMTLSSLPLVAGFFLVQCWLFASVGVVSFTVGSSLVRNWRISTKWALIAGLLSLFCVLFAGDWNSFSWFVNVLKSNLLLHTPSPSYWYPEPTRIIKGTISEIPIYSFLVADLHAHVWGYLLAAVQIAALAAVWLSSKKELKHLLVISFLLGISVMTNSWDYLTLGSLVVMVLFLSLKSIDLVRRLSLIVICLGLGLGFSLPWLAFFSSPLSGFGFVVNHSQPIPWLLFWGPSFFLVLLFLAKKLRTGVSFEKDVFVLLLFAASIFWVIFLELFYAKDILSGGEWFRANTYFKVSLQILLWIGIVSGPAIFTILRGLPKPAKLFIAFVLTAWFLSRSVYPLKAINQSSLENKTYTGLSSGLIFWQTKYPHDFAAYQFLTTQNKGVILEAEGDSYQDTNFFSTFLGWPTVSGWPIHEWTWQGTYDEVGKRAADVREIYTGKDFEKTKKLLKKYHVTYIIISSTETQKYQDLNLSKLYNLGKVIYQPNLSGPVIISLQ